MGKMTRWVKISNGSNISNEEKELHIAVNAVTTNSCNMKLYFRNDRGLH